MIKSELHKLLSRGERQTLDFKAGDTAPELVARAVCALLNQTGGQVVIGASEQGKISGVTNVSKKSSALKKHLTSAIAPRALWTVEQMSLEGNDVLVVEVPEGLDKPYVVEGAIYLRPANRVQPASRDQISDLIFRRSAASQRWERQIMVGADLSNLDARLVAETLGYAVESDRWSGKADDHEGFLHSLGLMSNGGITHAAMLLYGKKPTQFLPQARVRLVVMPEGKTGSRFTLDKMFEGPLLRIAAQIPQELSAHTGGVSSRFTERDWQREERQRYPMTALREAVMNALVHRDYESNGSILISIHPKTLRISNPGGLPSELTLADLKRDHPSLPRNPDIAHACFLHRLIEKIGRGTQRILEDCRKASLDPPKWNSSRLEMSITFTSGSEIGVKGSKQRATSRQQEILAILQKHKEISVKELRELFGSLPERTLRYDLQVLLDAGSIVRQGQANRTIYRLHEAADAK